MPWIHSFSPCALGSRRVGSRCLSGRRALWGGYSQTSSTAARASAPDVPDFAVRVTTGSVTARSPVRTTRPIRYSLLWYSLAVSTKLTPMVERASDLRTGGSQRLRGIAWLNPKSKSPSEKFAVRYTLAHHTGQNQELLRLASKWRCSQLDAPPTPKLWFPGTVKSAGLFLRVARYPHRPPKSC